MMIERNTMQYGTDSFALRCQSLLKVNVPFDLSRETACKGFEISGVEPEGSTRRIIFEVDGELYYFTNDGLTRYPYYGELSDVLEYGNTVGELLAINGIVQWVGKKVYPIIALDAPRNADVMPKVRIGLKVSCYNDELQREELSPIFELKHGENPARITQASYNKANTGYAKSKSLIRVRDKFDEWSDWLAYSDVINKEANAVQFKSSYTLTTLDGTDEAKIFDCNVEYVTDSSKIAGDTLEIFTNEQQGDYNIGTIYAQVKHSELEDADIKVYVKFSDLPLRREKIVIGRGTGELTRYYLGLNGGIDRNIDQNTIHIFAGSAKILDVYYNTNYASVDVKADEGVDILASYEYNLDNESWREMALQGREFVNNIFVSKYVYRTDAGKKVFAIRVSSKRQNGKVEEEILGSGTGRQQIFVLPHRAKAETLKVSGSFVYDEEGQIIKTTAPVDETLKLSYEYSGVLPEIHSLIVGAEYVV